MTSTIKVILFGFLLCIIGGVLLDLEVKATGFVFICLGVMAIMAGPFALQIDD